jgi:hypothetical protein
MSHYKGIKTDQFTSGKIFKLKSILSVNLFKITLKMFTSSKLLTVMDNYLWICKGSNWKNYLEWMPTILLSLNFFVTADHDIKQFSLARTLGNQISSW